MLVNGEKIDINEIDKDKRKININDDVNTRSKLCSDNEAESGADRYIRLLAAPECRLFFLKVMYHLPYEERERILEASKKPWVREPKKFFTFCAKKELAKLGF